MFSRRIPADLSPNRVTAVLERLREDGRNLIDLTEANPTRAGLLASGELLSELGRRQAAVYDPAPFGHPRAREAVALDFARRGLDVSPGRILLTASTSEAYSLLFKLLCDPGDEVLVPRPSYPLFDHLTRLDAVTAVPYALEHHGVWSVNVSDLASKWSPRTRAVLVVSPNNPTGSMLSSADRAALVDLCAARHSALIADEVFADYRLEPLATRTESLAMEPRVLSFSLGGLSKALGLPQLKVAWTTVSGPTGVVDAALARLEIIADAYLSVNTPAQLALATLFERGVGLRDAILTRVRSNYDALGALVRAHPSCERLRAEGGWSTVVRVPAIMPDEALAVELLERDGVLVHPGYFFDFDGDGYLALSLLPEPERFHEGVSRVLHRVERLVSTGAVAVPMPATGKGRA